MRLPELSGAHLTYCTNIHPGESLAAVKAVLASDVPLVKARVCPEAPFGVGLRLAAAACDDLLREGGVADLRAQVAEADLYVFTLNGFPYGAFHGTRVKESVYRPDWREDERVRYTIALAQALAALLPDGVDGSISTVPGAFRPRASGPAVVRRIVFNLVRVVAELVRLEDATGRHLTLALEPEPECLLETSADALAFFRDQVWAAESIAALAGEIGRSRAQAEERLRRHLGVCLDACHASVELESPRAALAAYDAAGVRVAKIQLSAALRVQRADPERLAALAAFADDVYLHQVVVRQELGTRRYVDLPDALAAPGGTASREEWRVHFHVPVFRAELGPFASTQDDLRDLLAALRTRSEIPHLEVETYTWDVLPAEFRDVPVAEAVARELAWVRASLTA